jgi:soluble P-type ATPase
MLRVRIPGYGSLSIAHLVLDYNGTLAVDGNLLPRVKERLRRLANEVRVHTVTADTFGRASSQLKGVACELVILGEHRQDHAKAAYVRRLGPSRTACVGNGRNDRLMLRAAALGIAVIQAEGAAAAALQEADLVVTDVRDALDLLLNPLRLVAGLRS